MSILQSSSVNRPSSLIGNQNFLFVPYYAKPSNHITDNLTIRSSPDDDYPSLTVVLYFRPTPSACAC